MASIVTNQQRAFQAQAEDAARALAYRLEYLSPAQQAAILASVAKNARVPVDITLTTEHRDDALDAAVILDGDLTDADDATWCWDIGSGCRFQIVVTQDDHR